MASGLSISRAHGKLLPLVWGFRHEQSEGKRTEKREKNEKKKEDKQLKKKA
jgi:hypothetical protein